MRFLLFLFTIIVFVPIYADSYDEAAYAKKVIRLEQSGRYREAVDLLEKMITDTGSKPFSEAREVTLVQLYMKTSELYLHLHKKEKALVLLEKASTIDIAFVPPAYRRQMLQLFCGLGQKSANEGNYKRAVLFMKQAYRLSADLYGKKHMTTLNYALELGNLYYNAGRYSEAVDVMKSAYDVIAKQYPKENIERLKVASSLGSVLAAGGEYKKGLRYQLFALEHLKVKNFQSAKILASMHNTTALTYLYMGAYVEAEEHLKSALMLKKRYRQYDESLVKIYNHYGMLYEYLGNESKALQYYRKALALALQLPDHGNVLKQAIYANMAQLYMGREENKKAVEYFEKALVLSRSEEIEWAYILSNLGILYQKKGALEKAQQVLEHALLLKKRYLGKNHLSLVPTLLNMAALFKKQKKIAAALKMEKQALNILKGTKAQHDLLQRTYYAMAETYTMLGDRQAAYDAISKSAAHFLQLKVTAYSMTSQQEKSYFKKAYASLVKDYFAVTYVYIEGLDDDKKQKVIQALFADWVKLKHSIFDVSDAFRVLARKSSDKAVKACVQKLFSAQRQLARYYQERTIDSRLEKQKEIRIKTLRKEIAEYEKYLSKKVKEAKISDAAPDMKMAQISKYIPKDGLYMDFSKIAENYYLFSVDSKGRYGFWRFDKIRTKEIENLITEIYACIGDISAKKDFADIERAKRQYGKLFKLLDKEVHFSKKRSLVISPDGLLNLLPFEALYNPKTKRFLVDDIRIYYVSSAKDMAIVSKRSHTVKPSIVIFANPDFDANLSNSVDEKHRMATLTLPSRFKPLPGTEREAAAISGLFPYAQLFEESNATEEALLQLHSPKILHIATHGFFLKENSSLSPLMKTGIVLSAANSAIATKKGEGIVTGLELAGLDLEKTDLVVLSSCYSGIGDIENGEGMATLGDAFKKAGAKNVLGSLWTVNDMMGEKLMEHFYERIKQGIMYSDALRDAKRYMIKQGFSHPYYWAGFILYSKGKK